MTEPTSAAILDQAHFAVMTGDDRALQVEIVGLFRGQVATWRGALAPDAPVATWATAVHTLKGSARGIGLWPLAEACAAAEQAANDGPAAIAARLTDLGAALDAALGALSAAGFA